MTTNTKTDCFEYLTDHLRKTSAWRRDQATRFPKDKRNERAAETLLRLADTAAELSEHQWLYLNGHFQPKEDSWRDLVARCTRDVCFRSRPDTFADYVETIIDAMVAA